MPYVMFGGIPGAGELNALGYPGIAPVVPKPGDEYRIICLGGSTIVSGEPTIPEILQRSFDADGNADIRVYNFGVVSSVSGMELARVVFELPRFEPDMIVMYNGGNDVLTPFTWDPRPGSPFNFAVYEHNPILESEIGEYPTLLLLAYGSNILRNYWRRKFTYSFVPMAKLQSDVQYNTDEWRSKIADVYVSHLVMASTVAEATDSRFLAFFQPILYYKAELVGGESRFASDDFAAHAVQTRELVLERIQIARENEELIIRDLSGLFEEDVDGVFVDNIHIRQRAKYRVSEAIYEELESRLKTWKPE
jgi:hypothetical protein